jgi:HAD superfamily hydrolase (TIGR01509 family)
MSAIRHVPVRAVVFDLDGTLADTERLSDLAWTEVLARRGYAAGPADFAALVGRPVAANLAHFAARVELGDPVVFRAEVREVFLALVAADLRLHDDAVDALRALAGEGVAVGVATSSTREHAARVLAAGGLEGLVGAVVAAEDVERHKPDPAPYLEALRRLDVPPGAASAVEDTPVGAASARAAGAWTVAVRRAHAVPELAEAADVVVDLVTVEVLRSRPVGTTQGHHGAPGSRA